MNSSNKEHYSGMFPNNPNNLTSHSVYEALPPHSTNYLQQQLAGKMVSKTNRSQSNEPPQSNILIGKKQLPNQNKKGVTQAGLSRNVIDNIFQQNLSGVVQPSQQVQLFTNSNRNVIQNLLSSQKPLDSANSTSNGLQQTTKKTKKLRKNFDMLAQAMKANLITGAVSNNQQSKKKSNGGITTNDNITSYGLQDQQVFQNVMFNQTKAPLSAHHQQDIYGKKQSSNVYEAFINQNQKVGGNAQSQRAGSQQSSLNQYMQGGSIPAVSHHNNSLFSHISLKESPQKQQKKGNQIIVNSSQTRNPSLQIQNQVITQGASSLLAYNQPAHHNLSHQTQPLSLPHHEISKQGGVGSILNSNLTNERLTKRYGQGITGVQSRKSQENILEGAASITQQQPILNINTASDINIYNNSFIVSTAGLNQQNSSGSLNKKPHQSSSRSSSIKRGQIAGAYNPASGMKKQLMHGKFMNLNSAGAAITTTTAGANLQNLLGLNNEYNPQGHQVRTNSQSRLSSTSNDHLKRYNQIAEAYTTTNFFQNLPQGGQGPANNLLLQNVGLVNTQKKMIKLNTNANNKKSTSHGTTVAPGRGQTFNNQQSYTQSFDNMQPFNSSSELVMVSSSSLGNKNHLKKQATSSGGKIKFASNQQSKSSNKQPQMVKYSQSQHRLQGGSMVEEPFMFGTEGSNYASSKSNLQIKQSSSSQIANMMSKAQLQSQQLLAQAKKKVLDKDYKAAIALLTEALELDPHNCDAKFYRALSQLDQGMNKEAIDEFCEMIAQKTYNAQVCYILLSIAYKRANDSQMSFNTLSECIAKCPNYPDAYLARGQQYLIQERYQEALADFSHYTTLNPSNGMGFLGVGDSNKALHKWPQAITAYSKALKLFSSEQQQTPNQQSLMLGPQITQATLKRGFSYFHVRLYQQAMLDFQAVLKTDPTSIKAHFYFGKILSRQYLDSSLNVKNNGAQNAKVRQKIQNEAILHFEQVVKYHTANGGEVYAGNALFEISRLRLHDKDFYEAYFNLKRAVDSNFNSKRLQLYKDFTEGVLYLIKRKIKKGVQILSDLLEILVNNKDKKDRIQLEELRHQSYLYRAYGYVAIEKYEVALQDIKRAKKIKKLDAATIYNKLLGKGILRMDHEDYIMATKYFTKASMKFPSNKDSYCLHIISMVRSYSYTHAQMTIDQEEKREKIIQAKLFMDSAIRNCDYKVKVPSLYFFRGLLNFQLHQFYAALKDFNVSIEEEEEPTPSYYLARGRTYACLSILTEAMKDLSIALNLDETIQEAYIYRGKCAYLLGDNNLAFLDFQRLILTDPKNPMVHVYAGNLLMTTGAYQDAIKAFLNADTVQKTAVAAFQRARCYCALTDLENAKMQFKIAFQLSKNQEDFIQLDSQVLSTLMRVINASQNAEVIKTAIDLLNQQIKLFEDGNVSNFRKKDASLNIQIIPNVKRIKIEKFAVAKELISLAQNNQDGQQRQAEVSLATEELLLGQSASASIDLGHLDEILSYSYYFENVFSLEDLYLYRAVYHFYKRDYPAAISDYLKCQSIKINGVDKPGKTNNNKSGLATPQESMMVYSRSSTPLFSMNSSKTDLSDVGLCSLNVHETNYNIMLCHLMSNNYDLALEKANDIINQAPGKYQRHFFLIRGLIYEALDKTEKANKDYQKYEKAEPKNFETYLKEGRDLIFEPFPQKQRLCGKFDAIKVQHIFSKIYHNTKSTKPRLLLKPSFSMPFIKPPNMIPNIDEEAIQGEFTLKQIDAPMPEAPWIRRVQCTNNSGYQQNNQSISAIKFTDHILMREEGEDNYGQEEEDYSEDRGSEIDVSQIRNDASGYLSTENKQSKMAGGAKERNQKTNQEEKKGGKQKQDLSYMQSLEIPDNKNTSVGMHQQVCIAEQILKRQQEDPNSKAAGCIDPMMVYQLVGNNVQGNGLLSQSNYNNNYCDELSDKHKISLFDDSRFESISVPVGTDIYSHSISVPQGPSDEYDNTASKTKKNTKNRKQNNRNNNKNRILTSSKTGQDALQADDSLLVEDLLDDLKKLQDVKNQYGDVEQLGYSKDLGDIIQFGGHHRRQLVEEDDNDDDPDSSSCSSSEDEYSSSNEENSGKKKNKLKHQQEEVKSSYPINQVDDSMVILGGNKNSKRKRKQQDYQQQRLVISTDLHKQKRPPHISNIHHTEEEDDQGTNGRDSIFRSRQSSKR